MKKEMLMGAICIVLLLVMPLVFAASYSGDTELEFSVNGGEEDAGDEGQETASEGMTNQQQIILWTVIVIVLLVILSYGFKKKKKKRK